MAKVKLPAGPQELTAEWLTAALRDTATLRNASVTGPWDRVIIDDEWYRTAELTTSSNP